MKLHYALLRCALALSVIALTLSIQMDATASLTQSIKYYAFHSGTVNMSLSAKTTTSTPTCVRTGYRADFAQSHIARVGYDTDANHSGSTPSGYGEGRVKVCGVAGLYGGGSVSVSFYDTCVEEGPYYADGITSSKTARIDQTNSYTFISPGTYYLYAQTDGVNTYTDLSSPDTLTGNTINDSITVQDQACP